MSKTWVRYPTSAEAIASAKRLARKYGNLFAVTLDDMGIRGFSHPYAVISPVSVTSAR